MRASIEEYKAVEAAAMKFVKSVAEGNSRYAKELFIDEAVLHQRDDNVTAAKSERAQRERGAEQLEQRNFFFHRTPPLCSLFSIDLFAYIVHQRIFYRRKMNTAARVNTCGCD